MFALLISWGILAVGLLIVATLRKLAVRGKHEILHFADSSFGNREQEIARRMDKIDAWGKWLAVALVVYGVGLLGLYLYTGWQNSLTLN